MAFRAVITNVLLHLHGAEFANDPRPQQKADKKGCQAGINGPKRNVTKYIKD
jgi:hypothetical protein